MSDGYPMKMGMGAWAYAVIERNQLDGPDGDVDLSWLSGVGEAGVRTITCSGLTVLASDVSLAEFGEAALREKLEDLAWLEEVARLHHDVVSAAARLVPLLPVRLATVYSDDAAARAALTEHHDQLVDALHRVAGRVEWGVKAYAAGDQHEDEDEAQPPAASSGLAYLRRRRDQLAAVREARSAAAWGARKVHAELADKAAAAMIRPPQAAQLSGVRLPMLLNATYLTGAADGRDFTAAVAAEAAAHPELRVDLTGPWPPYSFAGDGNGER